MSYPTSWSAKLFVQEMESMNVGIKRIGDPHTYDESNDKIFEEIEAGRSGK